LFKTSEKIAARVLQLDSRTVKDGEYGPVDVGVDNLFGVNGCQVANPDGLFPFTFGTAPAGGVFLGCLHGGFRLPKTTLRFFPMRSDLQRMPIMGYRQAELPLIQIGVG